MDAELKQALEGLLSAASQQLTKAEELLNESDLDIEGPMANSIQALTAALAMARRAKLELYNRQETT
jgi:hypothetical protein